MNLLKKIKNFAVTMLFCGLLASFTLTSCNQGASSDDDAQEESAEKGDSTEHPKGEHPKGDAEHPKADSTEVQNQ